MAYGGFGTFHLFASYHTLLAGNLSKSTLPFADCSGYKFFILEEKPEYVSVQDFGCFWGYLARLTCACTALYHSSTLLLPCLKLVRRSKWAHTSFDWGLQNSSNFPQIVSKVNSSDGKLHETYWSMPKSPLQAISFPIFVTLAKLQGHIPEYFHISSVTLKTHGTAHH